MALDSRLFSLVAAVLAPLKPKEVGKLSNVCISEMRVFSLLASFLMPLNPGTHRELP